MKQSILLAAGIDVNEGIDRFGGNRAVYEKFLYRFKQEPTFSELCEAIEKQNLKEAFAAAHTLKGQSGNLSMNRLYDDICPLVEELRSGSLQHAEELLQPVIRDYRDIIAVLAE